VSWYHTVSPARPSDDRLRGASLLARHLWTHFLVSELASRLPGLVRGGLATIAEHIDESPESTLTALEEMRDRGVVEFDLQARVIRLVHVALEDFEIPAKSGATISGWLRVARELPRCEVVARHAEEFAELCPARADDWHAIAARCRRLPPARALAGTKPPPGAPEGPPGGAPSALPNQDLDPDLDPDLDLDPPLPPKGGIAGLRAANRVLIADDERAHPEVPEALEILASGRDALGCPALPPSAREVRGAVQRLREREALPLLPGLVRRHVEHVRQALAEGRDERATLTLRGVVRRLDALAVADDERARAPPSSQALADPAADDF